MKAYIFYASNLVVLDNNHYYSSWCIFLHYFSFSILIFHHPLLLVIRCAMLLLLYILDIRRPVFLWKYRNTISGTVLHFVCVQFPFPIYILCSRAYLTVCLSVRVCVSYPGVTIWQAFRPRYARPFDLAATLAENPTYLHWPSVLSCIYTTLVQWQNIESGHHKQEYWRNMYVSECISPKRTYTWFIYTRTKIQKVWKEVSWKSFEKFDRKNQMSTLWNLENLISLLRFERPMF